MSQVPGGRAHRAYGGDGRGLLPGGSGADVTGGSRNGLHRFRIIAEKIRCLETPAIQASGTEGSSLETGRPMQ